MKRLEALEVVDRELGKYPLIVTCGATAREMDTLGARDNRLPLLDSMGLTSAVALGVALGIDGPVGVVDGDGSLLMGFSILATLATTAPPNLTLIVLDNGQHASADMMPSQAAQFDLVAAIRGCGFRAVAVDEIDGLATALRAALQADKLTAVVARIEPGNAPGIPLLLADPAVLAARFADALQNSVHEQRRGNA